MANRNTKQSTTASLLAVILYDVNKYLRIKKRSEVYSTEANKLRVRIFVALEKIPKEDFALYKEKIERITKRLNKQ